MSQAVSRTGIEAVTHQFEPVFDKNSKVLILGTMPSPKSREQGFYYGHPRNRFWKVIADVLEEPVPETTEEKRNLILSHQIAVWDVLASCEIHGADDSTIQNPVPNDMNRILLKAPVKAVFTTGGKAAALYKKYCLPQTKIEAQPLPSTSPANCGMSYERLLKSYQEIRKYLV